MQLGHLTFINCTINLIQANAFNEHAFYRLQRLYFADISGLVKLVPGWSTGLCYLYGINIFGMTIENANDIALESIGETLRHISLEGLTNNIDLRDVFGRKELPALETVGVQYAANVTVDRFLDSNSFSALIVVHSLSASHCRIVAVHDGTFEHLKKLFVIDLTYNRLKDLSSNTFISFFNADSQSSIKRLQFSENPMRCNCNYYELKNMSVLNPFIAVYYDECDDDHQVPFDPSKCRRMQMIRKRMNCFRSADFGLFGHPVIEFRILDNGTEKFIRIESETGGPFKMFVLDTETLLMQKNCSRSGLRCILLPNGTSIIPLSHFGSNASIVSFFATLNMNPALVWPLNYHSIISGKRETKMEEDSRWCPSPFAVAFGSIIWLLGTYVVCIVAYKCSEPPNSTYVRLKFLKAALLYSR